MAEGGQKTRALLEIMEAQLVIPVLKIERVEDAVPLARALARGGLPAIEITLRTPAALEAIPREGSPKGRPRLAVAASPITHS